MGPPGSYFTVFKHLAVILANSHKPSKVDPMLKGEDSGGRTSHGKGELKVSVIAK